MRFENNDFTDTIKFFLNDYTPSEERKKFVEEQLNKPEDEHDKWIHKMVKKYFC